MKCWDMEVKERSYSSELNQLYTYNNIIMEVLFRGVFDQRAVAVKRILPECFELADREVCSKTKRAGGSSILFNFL